VRCVHARRVPSHSCWYAALATDEERTGSAWGGRRRKKKEGQRPRSTFYSLLSYSWTAGGVEGEITIALPC